MTTLQLETWPVCHRCRTPVEAYELVDFGKAKGVLQKQIHGQFEVGHEDRFVEVRVRCHGAHDGVKIRYRPWWPDDPIKGWSIDDWADFTADLAMTPFFHRDWYKLFGNRDQVARAASGRLKLPEDPR